MTAVWIIVGTIIAIFVLAIIVLIHELGHFLAAKAVGIKVTHLALGFGPEIVGWDRGETHYSIKWILAGGYVKILGMNPEEEVPEEDKARSYPEAPYWKRSVVILAGSMAHVLTAMVLFYLIFWPIGYTDLTGRVGKVQETVEISDGTEVTTPASQVGLEEGDLITEINGVEVSDWTEISEQLSEHPGETVELTIQRDGRIIYASPTLLDVGGRGILGFEVDIEDTYKRRSNPITAVWQSIRTTGETTAAIFKGLASLFSWRNLRYLVGLEPRTVESPRSIVGAAEWSVEAAQRGISDFMAIMAVLLIFFAIFNLIPLPPLDGSHLLVIVVEKVFKREIDLRKLIPIAWVVIIVLSLIAVRLMASDAYTWIKGL